MRNFLGFVAMIAFGLGFALAVSATTEQLRGEVAANFNRAGCRYTPDNIQVTAVPSAAVASTGLQAATRYRVFCTTATYFDQEAVGGSGGAATSADAQIAANTAIDVWSKAGDFVSFRAVAATGTCDLLECQ
jgi:hypothetical protein